MAGHDLGHGVPFARFIIAMISAFLLLARRWARGREAGQKLAAEAWGKGWGIYVTSHQTLAMLRNHLRRFQTLMTPDGAEFQFRLFNPVLVRSFLPALSAMEAKALFGPIAGILTEGAAPGDLMLFMPGPEGTLQKTIPLAAGAAPGL